MRKFLQLLTASLSLALKRSNGISGNMTREEVQQYKNLVCTDLKYGDAPSTPAHPGSDPGRSMSVLVVI